MSLARSKLVLLLSGLAAALALAVAFASEWYGGLVPCALCLVERWPYRVMIAVAVAGLLLPARWARAALVVMVLAGLASVLAAVVHVGVERRYWPSPLPECAAPRITGATIAERLAQMPAKPSKACEDPVYPVEAIPVSFAELNLLYGLVLTGGLVIFLARTNRSG